MYARENVILCFCTCVRAILSIYVYECCTCESVSCVHKLVHVHKLVCLYMSLSV